MEIRTRNEYVPVPGEKSGIKKENLRSQYRSGHFPKKRDAKNHEFGIIPESRPSISESRVHAHG
jgi:hypothetical protein